MYKSKVEDDEIEIKEYKSLLQSLMLERELMIDELDYHKQSHYHHDDYKWSGITLLINDLDEETLNTLSVQAKYLDLPLPEFINILMELANDEFESSFPSLSSSLLKYKIGKRNVITINHVKSLVVLPNDLAALEADDLMVNFHHVEFLDLSKISFQLFVKYVSSIQHCGHVVVPQKWSKLALYFKSRWCDYYEFI